MQTGEKSEKKEKCIDEKLLEIIIDGNIITKMFRQVESKRKKKDQLILIGPKKMP